MKKLFLDTSFFIALFVKNDTYNKKAVSLVHLLKNSHELWIHEGIILEIADWFSSKNKNLGIKAIESIYKSNPKVNIVNLNSDLIEKSLILYKKYSDKTVGITDCISFQVMWDNNIQDSLTSDRHFQQVGFNALLL